MQSHNPEHFTGLWKDIHFPLAVTAELTGVLSPVCRLTLCASPLERRELSLCFSELKKNRKEDSPGTVMLRNQAAQRYH